MSEKKQMDETFIEIEPSKYDFSEEFRQLGLAIAYYRRARKMTQELLAEKVGISREHLAAIEAPGIDRKPSMELVFAICRVLEIKPWQLFKLGVE